MSAHPTYLRFETWLNRNELCFFLTARMLVATTALVERAPSLSPVSGSPDRRISAYATHTLVIHTARYRRISEADKNKLVLVPIDSRFAVLLSITNSYPWRRGEPNQVIGVLPPQTGALRTPPFPRKL